MMNAATHDSDAEQPSMESASPGQPGGTTVALAVEAPRDWLLPGADEFFRGVYTRCSLSDAETLAVCSAIAGEGKTTISLGLGVTLAQDFPERRVVVVETDLERPVLAADFGLEPSPGLTECLVHDDLLVGACRGTFIENLHLVPAGAISANVGRLLRSNQMVNVLQALRQRYDVVVLDVPAVLVSSDGLLLTDLADGTLLVVRSGVTPSYLVNRAIAQLDEDKLRGVVLNGAHSAVPGWLRRLCGL
jgi:capsular exopolysaccharide synthesis family protein